MPRKKVTIDNVNYDPRTLVNVDGEILNLQGYENVSAFARPSVDKKSVNVLIKVPFGKFTEPKEIRLVSDSPRRIDAIKKAMVTLDNTPMYRKPEKPAVKPKVKVAPDAVINIAA